MHGFYRRVELYPSFKTPCICLQRLPFLAATLKLHNPLQLGFSQQCSFKNIWNGLKTALKLLHKTQSATSSPNSLLWLSSGKHLHRENSLQLKERCSATICWKWKAQRIDGRWAKGTGVPLYMQPRLQRISKLS